jgi:outer membrane protein
MNKFALRARSGALLTLTLTASLAWADPMPDNTLRLGEYWVFYHASANDISGPYVPADVNLSVKNVQTPYVAYLRTLSTHFTAELAFGVPPLTKTYGSGPATLGSVPYNGQYISSARWVAPTALIEYVFFDDSVRLRPYIGVGVNYTAFIDRNSTPAGNAASGGPTRIELPSSVGPAGTVGLTYRLPQHWSLMASYSASRVDSHLSAITAGTVRTTDISFGPQTFVFAVGYSF